MTQAEMNSKAMADIFALDDAKPMFEAFGNSLDLGIDPVEDDSPKSFDDLLEVNPSNVPSESEMFMQEGDDLQDPETQKFVVDKFAEVAMSRTGGSISPADLDDVATVIHGFGIKGDVRSFLEKAMQDAVQKQQSQNVSEAQPEGTVADFSTESGAAPAEPVDAGIGADVPAMDPMAPTAEPTLEPNAGETDDLGPIGGDAGLEPLPDDGLGADAGLGDETGLDGLGDLGGEGADVGGDEGLGDEGGIDLGGDETEGGDDELGELDAGNLEGLEDLDDDSDEDKGEETETNDEDTKDDEPKADDDESKEDDSKSEDDDFNFESIAQKASSLMEGTEEGAEQNTEIEQSNVEENFDKGQDEGAAVAEETSEGSGEGATEETPLEECGAATAAPVATDNLEECGDKPAVSEDTATEETPAEDAPIMENKEAVCEAISTRYKMKKVADTVRSLIESYNRDQKLASTVARMESVISDFKESAEDEVKSEAAPAETTKDAQLESIIDNFAKASRENAEKLDMKKAFQATMESVQNAKKAILAKKEREQKLDAQLESIVADAAQKVNVEPAKSETDAKLESILESVKSAKQAAALEAARKSEADKLQKELDAIVESVRNA